ncbi:YiaA/YiaB family inner membrane protein [Nocardiopsis suaedae]|uniref:YiaA/YiaB family inner membrane protein n=1 Tax=Nocardiopsis suaedae TaxID=3018444 RepID=A0ABT4TSB7_9ACTN|nr:YiaA/YiaB family inner membrane protein [Nocardiopsis suaedae]MDA2807585.1 YiaA/YiaB family inner membrane protein [Nocardiopsis suaedae]
MTTPPVNSKVTPAFYLQSVIAFGVSSTGMCAGVALLPVDIWIRAFLGMALLFVITSTFTLAKVIRDRQEEAAIAAWTEQVQAYSSGNQHAFAKN